MMSAINRAYRLKEEFVACMKNDGYRLQKHQKTWNDDTCCWDYVLEFRAPRAVECYVTYKLVGGQAYFYG